MDFNISLLLPFIKKNSTICFQHFSTCKKNHQEGMLHYQFLLQKHLSNNPAVSSNQLLLQSFHMWDLHFLVKKISIKENHGQIKSIQVRFRMSVLPKNWTKSCHKLQKIELKTVLEFSGTFISCNFKHPWNVFEVAVQCTEFLLLCILL